MSITYMFSIYKYINVYIILKYMQYESIINIFYIYLLYIYLTDLVADGICVTQDFTVVKTH